MTHIDVAWAGLRPPPRTEVEFAEQMWLDAVGSLFGQVPWRYSEALPFPAEVDDWIADYLTGDRSSLLLWGPPGTGKTHRLWDIRKRIAAAGWRPGEYWTLPELAARLRPGATQRNRAWDEDVMSPDDVVDRLKQSDLLFLDDLGAQMATQWNVDALYRIVDHRYSWGLPIVAATNAGDLAEVLGDRIASRLAGMSRTVKLTGPDRRREK